MVSLFLGKELLNGIEPDEVIAYGLAIEAGILSDKEDYHLEDKNTQKDELQKFLITFLYVLLSTYLFSDIKINLFFKFKLPTPFFNLYKVGTSHA